MEDWLTLRALHEHGTTAKAAIVLRISQSAVSKRIDRFSELLGVPLVERRGRRVVLTLEAERLLLEAEPLWQQLQEVLRPRSQLRKIRVAASESLLISWLPERLRVAGACELHAHRGIGVMDRVRSGQVELAICADAGPEQGLESRELAEESMVLVGGPGGDLWGIEPQSLTAQALEPRLQRSYAHLRVVHTLESYAALVQMSKAGFGPALVPEGVAVALQAPFQSVPDLKRRIVGVARRSSWRLEAVSGWWDRLSS